ncbi:DUF2510 domain-containing protein [Streptomyces sp. TRM43335]|uniref:DUF2510 domain-containing protein n=1 Tax=Streptomyces taklimakanensis TaxID=2569853 RepID=A0A6G2BAE6_9ACTN|nr:RDD family protein [Streptomyces taklimakanensis]MTE19230.1 DUF2510 domain-containing protein [Streptomyces taklimakanensis]
MSAPPSASANGSPGPGYYPDPSIPGYIRYWNGAAWVPGTSRPEPREGEPMPPAPPGVRVRQSSESSPAAPASFPPPSSPSPPGPAVPREREESPAEETGPVFLDEDGPEDAGTAPAPPGPGPAASALPEPRGRGEVDVHPGGRSEPVSVWRADPSRQSGPDGEREGRVSWGAGTANAPGAPRGVPELGAGPDPRALGPGSDPRGTRGPGDTGGTADRDGAGDVPVQGDGTMRMRPVRPAGGGDTVGLRRPEAAPPALPAQGVPAPNAPAPNSPAFVAPSPAAPAPGVPAPAPGVPAPAPAVNTPTPGDPAQPSWTRQVRELAQRAPSPAAPAPNVPAPAANPPASTPGLPPQPGRPGGPDGVTPWRPPADDPFLRAARQQARPAGLGRRLGARLVDGLLTVAVTGAVAFPFVGPTVDHFRERVEEVERAGVTRQVWLVDGTTGVYLAIVLGAFLLFGLLYEVLPTARWGRTLGKRLFGVTVLDIEGQDTPSFGAALRRWLVYGVLSLLAVGVVNVLWCLFDRPWRQCWHDKVARTFVARGSGETGLTG